MNDLHINIDTTELRSAIDKLAKGSRKQAARLLNQACLDVAYDAFKNLKPGEGQGPLDAQRSDISRELNKQLATRIRIAKSGKRAGRFIKKGGKGGQLKLKNLMVNKLRGKIGKKGLYGKEMLRQSARWSQFKSRSAGYLQATFQDIISTFNRIPDMMYRKRFANYKGRIWEGSQYYSMHGSPKSISMIARAQDDPEAAFESKVHIRPGQFEKVEAQLDYALETAMATKQRHLQNQVERMLQEEINKVEAP